MLNLTASTRDVAAYKRALLRDPCAYCNARANVLDHITPRRWSRGEGWQNLVGACFTAVVAPIVGTGGGA